MKKFAGAFAVAFFVASAPMALADGYYICTSGSSCGKYCRYSGSDNAENRKKCKNAGCRIGGTRSSTPGSNIKVCSASLATPSRHLAATDGWLSRLRNKLVQ
ncbi:MAG TPA: hypothetical protein ENJ99_06455 [Rhizobiales bacterium]|nr:hypothetical protein [Hyphomicrobiales bacterium]